MTLNEAINEITKEPRWYDGYMKQAQASVYLRDIRNGSAGHKKIKNFLEKFGYKMETNINVVKV